MANKWGKLFLFSTLAGAVAGGTYYYLQKKKSTVPENLDDFDDFDDFDDDLDDDYSTDTINGKGRSYMPIDLNNAKEIIGEKVIETLDKTKEKLEQLNVPEKIDRAKEKISEMTSPAAEPTYTEMDMSASNSSNDSDEAPVQTGFSTVSHTYSDEEPEGTNSAESEEFFNDNRGTM